MITLEQIQTELCQSEIGKVTSPVALARVIAQLSSSRSSAPPVTTNRIELEDGTGNILLESGLGYIELE